MTVPALQRRHPTPVAGIRPREFEHLGALHALELSEARCRRSDNCLPDEQLAALKRRIAAMKERNEPDKVRACMRAELPANRRVLPLQTLVAVRYDGG